MVLTPGQPPATAGNCHADLKSMNIFMMRGLTHADREGVLKRSNATR